VLLTRPRVLQTLLVQLLTKLAQWLTKRKKLLSKTADFGL
jgi:hypothetical protein